MQSYSSTNPIESNFFVLMFTTPMSPQCMVINQSLLFCSFFHVGILRPLKVGHTINTLHSPNVAAAYKGRELL